MAQPVWVTDAGSLGTIPEGIFYQIPLVAYDPADPLDNQVFYVLLAGQLPPGIQCTSSGVISGTPQSGANIQGVPSQVNSDTTSVFAVRAYTKKTVLGQVVIDRLADRTFSLTVTGQNPPQFITPTGNVGTFYDGTPIDPIQIQISDPDPGDTTVITVAAGTLPPGLSISTQGLITGYIIPVNPINETGGFDRLGQNFDMFPFDFVRQSPNTNYQFTLRVTDGNTSDLRDYQIYVYSRTTLQASTTDITSDDTFVDASQTPNYSPFLTNAAPSDLGVIRADNFWAYQFKGLTFGPYVIEYLEYPGAGLQLPPGTTLDPFTGWLYGYLPDLGITEITYNFAIYLIDTADPEINSDPYYFSVTVTGQVETQVIWLTDSDLGSIVNGSTSLLAVQAVNTGGRALQYRLRPGAIPPTDYVPGFYNKLPQGLSLLPSGEIAGRVSFNTFALDLGTTTFDQELRTSLIQSPQETTFDSQFTFTANAFSSDGQISVYKTFTVKILRVYNEPYENLYIKAMPPTSNRALINSLIQDSDIFPPDKIFRSQDPNFGVATSVIYDHCFGLTSSTYELYISSLIENHYWKNLILGEIKTAQAIDPATGNVIYEVVYSAIQDNLVNNSGISVSKQVTLPYPINAGDSTEITTVYPNSLDNMRNQVIDVVGQISNLLPLWMLSKQANGKVLGFTPAWVIAYCNPGTSGQIAYNVRTQFGQQLNLVDFEVDRYELDRLLSIHWDPIADSTHGAWVPPGAETTFDLLLHYVITSVPAPWSDSTAYAVGDQVLYKEIFYVAIQAGTDQNPETQPSYWTETSIGGGTGYNIGDKILIQGSDLSGTDGLNDVIVTVQDINTATGAITVINYTGTAPLLEQYSTVSITNLTIGIGSKTLNTSPGLSYTPGQFITIAYDQSNYMFGAVTSYSAVTGNLVVNVTTTAGTGTYGDWALNIAFNNISGTNLIGTGTGAQFDLVIGSGTATTFDATSMRFEAPVDIYTNTDAFDKYLVFPRRNILV